MMRPSVREYVEAANRAHQCAQSERLLISGCSTDDKTWRRLGSRCAVPAGVEDLQVDRWLPCCRSRTVNRFRARIPDVMAEHLERRMRHRIRQRVHSLVRGR